MKPDQRAEEKRLLGEALEAFNTMRAVLFALERFYVHLREAGPRHREIQAMAAAVLDLKVRLVDVSEAAAKEGPR